MRTAQHRNKLKPLSESDCRAIIHAEQATPLVMDTDSDPPDLRDQSFTFGGGSH